MRQEERVQESVGHLKAPALANEGMASEVGVRLPIDGRVKQVERLVVVG